jgi:hypothetical protein
VIPALAVVSLLAVAFLRFLWALPSGTRNRFLIAATSTRICNSSPTGTHTSSCDSPTVAAS